MRQLTVQVPRGEGQQVIDIATKYEALNLAWYEAQGTDGPLEVVRMHLSNRSVQGVLKEIHSLQDLEKVNITLLPSGAITFKPPASEAPEQVTNVEPRSPIEIFLSGLQSIGSWKGFLAYAAAGGVVVWIGMFTNIIYLLIAAMLIAPFAGPAMNVALATATGDMYLFRRSVLRYFVALVTTIVVAGVLSFLVGQQTPTNLMLDVSYVSSVAVLLPLVTGAAGALNLSQSENSSLVSGAAVGILVAASLAPPAGLVGMSIAMGLWNMAVRGVFVLILQLVGINLTGSLVFNLYGLSVGVMRYERGQRRVFLGAFIGSVLILAALLGWQFSSSPNLNRPTLSERVAQEITVAVEHNGLVDVAEVRTSFVRSDVQDEEALLGVVYVYPKEGTDLPMQELEEIVQQGIEQRLLRREYNFVPLIDVVVLTVPDRLP